MRHQLSQGPHGTLCDVTSVTSCLCVPDLPFSHPPAPHIVLLCFLKFQVVFDPKLVLQAHLQDLSWSFQAQRAGCRCTPGLGPDAFCVWGCSGDQVPSFCRFCPPPVNTPAPRAPEEKGTPSAHILLGLGRLGWRPLGGKASSPSHLGAVSGMCQPRHLPPRELHTRCMKHKSLKKGV